MKKVTMMLVCLFAMASVSFGAAHHNGDVGTVKYFAPANGTYGMYHMVIGNKSFSYTMYSETESIAGKIFLSILMNAKNNGDKVSVIYEPNDNYHPKVKQLHLK